MHISAYASLQPSCLSTYSVRRVGPTEIRSPLSFKSKTSPKQSMQASFKKRIKERSNTRISFPLKTFADFFSHYSHLPLFPSCSVIPEGGGRRCLGDTAEGGTLWTEQSEPRLISPLRPFFSSLILGLIISIKVSLFVKCGKQHRLRCKNILST